MRPFLRIALLRSTAMSEMMPHQPSNYKPFTALSPTSLAPDC